MSEAEKTVQPTSPLPVPEAPKAEAPKAETPKVEAPKVETPRPGAPTQGGRPGGGPRGGGGRDFGDRPNRRVRDSVPSLDHELSYKTSSLNMKDLDAEIEAEMAAALVGVSEKDLFGADTSKEARKESGDKGTPGRKQGTVISVHGPDVFIEIPGGRSQGVLTMEHFPEGPPKKGDTVEVTIEGYDGTNGLLILSRKGSAIVADWSSIAEGMTVEARVLETNKGGLTVDVNGIRGFMPVSQIDLYRVEDMRQFVGQKLICAVTEVDKEDHNLIVSRRALLEKDREEQRAKLWAELAEGQIRDGIVRSVREFGAFVDLGGVDGLLHISEISWQRVNDVASVLQVGQSVKVVVLKLDLETRKISLGLKQLQASPWENIEERYATGNIVNGKVTRVMNFGAFVELEPGVEGLIPVSELARGKVWRAADFVKPDQMVSVMVLNVDPDQERISLSLKQALADAEPVKAEEEDEGPIEPAAPRVRNPNLRGGVGSSSVQFTMEEEGNA
jgi:small subunit ribosomal protein S1